MYRYEQRKLNIQLIPQTSWYKNLRSILPNWKDVSEHIRNTQTVCQICGSNDCLHAHEVWEYDDEKHEQSLKNIVCVCEACHNVIHMGHANIDGRSMEAMERYCRINQISEEEAKKDINDAFRIWRRRSQYEWHLNESQFYTKVWELTGINCNINAPINGKYYAKVSYEEKDLAKKYGARWDPERKMWYFKTEEERKRWDER